MRLLLDLGWHWVAWSGRAVCFLWDVLACVVRGRIRWAETFRQIYEQGVHSVAIIVLTSFASGVVLALQGYMAMSRFGAKEYISHLVGLSLVRELGPVFTALIFSGKAGARITAELGAMSVNDQVLATRALGVDPIEYLIVPRMIACFLVLPILTIIAEFVGITGGYGVGVLEAGIPGAFYINQTIRAIGYVDFWGGFAKVFFFAIIIGWICCYQGYSTSGGSLGVGKYTTKAVAFSYIFIILSNTLLTKIILTWWG